MVASAIKCMFREGENPTFLKLRLNIFNLRIRRTCSGSKKLISINQLTMYLIKYIFRFDRSLNLVSRQFFMALVLIKIMFQDFQLQLKVVYTPITVTDSMYCMSSA